MLGFSFGEIALVLVIAVIAIAPKDIPKVMRSIGKGFRQLNYTRHAISRQFDLFLDRDDEKKNNGKS